MRQRLRELVRRIHLAGDRRQHMPVETRARFDGVLAILDTDHEFGRAATADAGPDVLEIMGDVFGLEQVELDLLLVGAAIDLDANIGTAFGLLRGLPSYARPSVGLALELCSLPTISADALAYLGSGSPLRRHGLLALSNSEPWLVRELSVPERVLGHLVGHDDVDVVLGPLLLDPIMIELPGVDQLAGLIQHGARLCWVHTPLGAAGLSFAAAGFARLGLASLSVQMSSVLIGGQLHDVLSAAVREAALLGRGLIVNGAEQLADPVNRSGFAVLHDAVVPVVAVGSEPWNTDWLRRSPPTLRAPVLKANDRQQIWRDLVGTDQGFAGLTGLRLTPEAIADAAQHSSLGAAAAQLPLGVEVVRQSARQLGGAGKGLPASVGRRGQLADLILPPHIMAPLERFVRWARNRETMVESSSLFELGGKSPGLAALFTGSPGTGKTLAAHIVADELGLDLLPVDLPAVVDKYIGETEKNLERVFHAAESMNVVLFFDEADALFGRRSEVKDAHDRYANQEIAYLLQRMEQFDGITILATNLRGNIDQAFSRRMSAIVHFPDPDPATRKRLWQSQVKLAGRLDPADPVDFEQLAGAAEMSGGEIRNIALGAAYDAAAEGSPIGMRHLRAATVAEFHKLGRRMPNADFG